MHVILAVYVISAVSLLVVYFLVTRQTKIIPKRTASRSDRDERAMKTEKEKRKEEEKQTSKPQDLVPKKDAKGGWGVGGTTPIGVPPPGAVGLNPRPIRRAAERVHRHCVERDDCARVAIF